MTVFAVVAVILVAAGLAWLLRPLLGRQREADVHRETSNVAILRDQIAELDADLAAGTLSSEQHREARAELERRVLEEGRTRAGDPAVQSAGGARTAIALAFVIPVAAALLYLQLGSRDAFSPEATAGLPAGHPATGGDHSLTQAEVEQMVAKLAERMKQNPADPQGWAILARTYYVMQRFPEAADAYAKLAALVPDDADVLADYADSLAMAQGRTIAGKPLELVHRALKIDPTHWKALAMAGTEAFDRKDYKAAVGFWEKMRGSVPPDSDIARSIDSSIAEARELGGLKAGAPLAAGKGAPATPATVASASAADVPGRVAGTVSLSPGLAAKAKPEDVVFIFARPADGSRMPLAILRRQVKDLPVTFALDDTLAMSPASKLSAFSDVVVGARISRNGTAIPQSGDLEGLSAPVKVGASGIAVVIDKAVP